MNNNLKDEIKAAINNSLGDLLPESYVVQPKKFDLRTETLSEKTKQLRYKDFEEHVEALNQVSAALDGADRTVANNKGSDYRRLKINEAHLLNASFLRAMHFENISDLNSQLTMDSLAYIRLSRDFGGFDRVELCRCVCVEMCMCESVCVCVCVQ